MNPRSNLSDEYFSLELVRFYLERIKIKRASNPNAIIPLTNIEVWALARVIDSIGEEYVPRLGGTVGDPYLIEGVKQFLNPIIIPNGTLANHAITLEQLNTLHNTINDNISLEVTNLTNYIDQEISDLETYIINANNVFNQRLTTAEQDIIALQNVPPYVHPTVGARSETFTGAEVFSQFTTNNEGHVTNTVKRTLTLSNLGYTGTTNANFYEHPIGFVSLPETALSELEVISKINVDVNGHFTGISTRNLTLGVLGAEPSFNKGTVVTAGDSGISISGTLTDRLVNSGSLTFALASNVVRESNTNIITGLKTFTKAGPNDGSDVANVIKFNIDNTVSLYELYLKNSQNRNSPNGESNWFFTMVENYGGTVQSFDRLSFHIGGTTIIGGELPSEIISTDIQTWVGNNLGSRLPFPISTYIHRGLMVEDKGYFGKNNFDETLVLTSSDYLYSAGKVYGKEGFRGRNPRDEDLNGPAWELGSVIVDVKTESTHTARIRINDVLYDVLLSEVV